MGLFSVPPAVLVLLTTSLGLSVAENINISIPHDAKTRILLSDVIGYSIEPIWVDSFIRTRKAATLLSSIADITGKFPPIRVGGTTADQTYQHNSLPTGNASMVLLESRKTQTFNITP